MNQFVYDCFINIFNQTALRIQGTQENPWFNAFDCSKILNINFKNTVQPKHIINFDDDFEDEIYISTQGLFTMIMRSNKQECLDFQEIMFETIFPSVRELVINSNNSSELTNHIDIKKVKMPKIKNKISKKKLNKKFKIKIKNEDILSKLLNNMTL